MTEMRIAAAKELLGDYGISTPGDLSAVEKSEKDFETEKEKLNAELEQAEQELGGYGKLNEIYEQVKDGSCVNRLLRLELERQTQEERGRETERKL